MSDTVKPAEPGHKVMEKDFQMDVQFAYARACVTLPLGWTFEETLAPEFWTQIAHKFQKDPFTNAPARVGTLIEVRTVDHAFYGELYVRAVRERDLILGVLREPVYFGPRAVKETGGEYDVRWNVGKRGYDVMRKSDKEIIASAERFPVKEAALAFVASIGGNKAKVPEAA